MGNQELKDYFKGYAAVGSKHSYGPMGHRGLSVLIFESSAVGYVEAERLHKHFLAQGTGRSAWESKGKVLFYPGGKRQLYGFLARGDDLQEFNRHCQGKSGLKFKIKSYHEMVMAPMKQMRDDNQQLTWFKNKSATEQKQKEALEQSFNDLSDKHRRTAEENRILRERTRIQHEENMAEMDYQEQFFKDQIQKMQYAINTKEGQLELQEEGWKKVELSNELALNFGSLGQRDEELTKLKELQDDEIEKFMAEKEKLKQIREGKKSELSNKYWKEVMQVEEECNTALTKLMEKCA